MAQLLAAGGGVENRQRGELMFRVDDEINTVREQDKSKTRCRMCYEKYDTLLVIN